MKRNILISVLFVLPFFACSQNSGEKPAEITGMTVRNYEGHVLIDFWDEGGGMQMGFYPVGVNGLFSIAKVNYYPTLSNHRQGRPSGEFNSCTDWIGPYYVCGVSSVKEGLPQKFTGGWHGSNGDGTGKPTAATVETRLELDGTSATGNFERNCNQADLYVTNLIQGFDYLKTGKNLLKELVHYRIKPNRIIDMEVRIVALEDAVIQRYYGLQSQNFAIFDSVKYLAGQRVVNTEAAKTNSNCRSNDGVNTILITGNETKHRLKLVMNIEEGLGAPGTLGEGKPRAFTASYGKSYFNLINNKDLVMKKGAEVWWKGAYLWDQ